MELVFLIMLIALMAIALGSGFPVAFALPGSAILTIGAAALAGYLFADGNVDAYFAQGGPSQWLSAGVTNFRGIYWEVERDTLIAIPLFVFMGIMLQRSKIAEDLLVTMAQLFLQAEVPYKAAVILDKGLKDGVIEANERNWRLLSQAWTLAQEDEKAIPALIQAARLSDDGELDVRLAQAYFNLDDLEAAVNAARAGLDKGGLKRTDTANLLLGMALYNLERYADAKRAFRAAQRDQRSSRTAAQWIQHVSNEEARQEELRAALAD